jgi:hypothetical protein
MAFFYLKTIGSHRQTGKRQAGKTPQRQRTRRGKAVSPLPKRPPETCR